MHAEAYAFVRRVLSTLPERQSVVELGARDINGSVRALFGGAAYTGVDRLDGPGVDVVADAADWRPGATVDTVVCCEALEHAHEPARIVANAAAMLRPGGYLIATCATDDRAPHSGVDGGALGDDEHYRNVRPAELLAWARSGRCPLDVRVLEVDAARGDLYLLARRPEGPS